MRINTPAAIPTSFALATLLSFSAVAQADEKEAFALEPGAPMTTDADSTLHWDKPEQFKGVTRVVLPEYSIEFLTDNSASAVNGNVSVAMRWQLVGVGPTEFQTITDAAYSNLQQALTAAGFEVVSAETMQAHPAYSKMQAQGKPSGTATDSGISMAPSGMVVMPLGTISQREDSGAGVLGGLKALKTIGTVASAISGGFDTNEMALGLDATVLQLHIAVEFSTVGAKRGFLQKMSGEAEVSGTAKPSIAAGSTSLRFFTPAQKAEQLLLAQPLLLPTDTFTSTEEATSAATRAGNVAGALLRFGAGISGSSEVAEYVVTAEPEQYKLRMIDGLSQLNAAIVAKLVEAR